MGWALWSWPVRLVADASAARRPRPLKTRGFQLSNEGTANLPVKAERVNQASQSPAMRLAYREHF